MSERFAFAGTGSNAKENRESPDLPTKSLIPTFTRKVRQPLTPIQTRGRTEDNDMVKVKKTGGTNGNQQSCSKSNLTQIQKGPLVKQKLKFEEKPQRTDGKAAPTKIKNAKGVAKEQEKTSNSDKKTFSDQIVQTEHPDVELVTGEAAPPRYYEELAETRRVALEETLNENKELWEENERLKEKLEKLEHENSVLLDLVDADKLEEFHEEVSQLDEDVTNVSEEQKQWVCSGMGAEDTNDD